MYEVCHLYKNLIDISTGHGFKFGPIVGKVLCELSMSQNPSYDLSLFSIQRFQHNPK